MFFSIATAKPLCIAFQHAWFFWVFPKIMSYRFSCALKDLTDTVGSKFKPLITKESFAWPFSLFDHSWATCNSAITSSMVGWGWNSCKVALFRWRMSIYKRILSGSYPNRRSFCRFDNISYCRRRYNPFPSFSQIANAILLLGCTTDSTLWLQFRRANELEHLLTYYNFECACLSSLISEKLLNPWRESNP